MKNNICYIGGLSQARGIVELVNVCHDLSLQLNLAGKFESSTFEKEIKNLQGWRIVNYLGLVDRKTINDLLQDASIGVVTLYPTQNYLESLPVKMFEYMIAGIPVIASNFPLWREVIEKNNCGICIDPFSIKELKSAIEYLIHNPEVANEMGENGKNVVMKKFNWENEEKKLLSVYSKLKI